MISYQTFANRVRYLLISATAAFTLFSCNNSSEPAQPVQDTVTVKKDSLTAVPETPVAKNDSSLLTIAIQALQALDKKDYRAFASFIHPVKGIRFTPYGYIDTTTDVVMNPLVFQTMLLKKQPVKWGTTDGSGDPILLTLPKYLEKYVYDVKFVKPEHFFFNETRGKGNSVDNLSTIYPGLPFIESYFSGFDKKYSGLDWRSLRLVFDKSGDTYYLIALIHNQWTS